MTNLAGLITAGFTLGIGLRFLGHVYAALHVLLGSIVKGMLP
jgi:hypothetical protein